MSAPVSSYEHVEAAADAVRRRCGALPQTALILGSGLGDFADTLAEAVAMPYTDLPNWPASKVVGHSGKLVVGTVAGRRVAALAGRVHAYEGHPLSTVVFPTRVMGRVGVRELVVTNAAGGVNTGFGRGALMVIDDHINLLGANPLIGRERRSLRPAFPGHDRGVFQAPAPHRR